MGEQKSEAKFPKYLKQGTSHVALCWLGKRLKEIRATDSVESVAKASGVAASEIDAIEAGTFHLNVGRLWKVVHNGYRSDLGDLVAECYKANRENLDSFSNDREFERDVYYSVRRQPHDRKESTPLLIGGNPKSYLWAIPLRRLHRQPLLVEFLELAKLRKREDEVGKLSTESHDGVEIIHVIHGLINIDIRHAINHNTFRTLKAGDCIHFHSRQPHCIQNASTTVPAFLLIVRLPTLQA